MRATLSVTAIALAAAGCGHTRPATYVEVRHDGGVETLVSGAAGSGTNQQLACSMAVSRAVTALAEKYADAHDDLASEVAEAVGAESGEQFVVRFARDSALDAAVQDVQFDPIEHVCMAIVRWRAPAFARDAIVSFARRVKEAELGSGARAGVAPVQGTPGARASQPPTAAPIVPAPVATAPQGSSVAVAPATPASMAPPQSAPSSSVAPVAAAVAPPPPATSSAVPPAPAAPPTCRPQRRSLEQAFAEGHRREADYAECLRRTGNDTNVCVRYGMWVQRSEAEQASAGRELARCLNGELSTKLRLALESALPGHAARAVETRPDGTLVLWTLSPVDETAFALEILPDGRPGARKPLDPSQAQWLRQQLGL